MLSALYQRILGEKTLFIDRPAFSLWPTYKSVAVPDTRWGVFLAVLMFSSAIITAVSGSANAATGVIALDEAAIAVRAPDHVFLDTIASAGARLVAGGEHGVIIYSDDNGATWKQATVPVDATLTSIAFASPANGWAVGNYGVILHTSDSGKTWQSQFNGTQIGKLSMIAAEQANADGSKSPGLPDAVRRANIMLQQGPDKPFLSVLALSDEKAMAFGAFRITVKTDDAGKTWQDWSLHIDDPLSHHIYGATQVGSSIYLSGEAGLVFRSNDGGNEFKELSSPTSATLFGVLGTDNGILVYGVAGTAFRSSDDGQTWQQISVDPTDDLTAAIMLKSGDILLASGAGKLLVSHDNGASFEVSPVNCHMAVGDLIQAADGSITAVGYRGVVHVTLNSISH